MNEEVISELEKFDFKYKKAKTGVLHVLVTDKNLEYVHLSYNNSGNSNPVSLKIEPNILNLSFVPPTYKASKGIDPEVAITAIPPKFNKLMLCMNVTINKDLLKLTEMLFSYTVVYFEFKYSYSNTIFGSLMDLVIEGDSIRTLVVHVPDTYISSAFTFYNVNKSIKTQIINTLNKFDGRKLTTAMEKLQKSLKNAYIFNDTKYSDEKLYLVY